MAGHSHWAGIKHKKGRQDKLRSKIFSKISREITVAAKLGSKDPDTNHRLRAAIETAKDANMPKENIERAIKKASDKDTSNYKEALFEGYAPHGIAILIETATDNNNRTVANVRSYFNKCDGSLGTSGSVEFMFEHKCNFMITNTGQDIEELEFELIDAGAEEVFEDEGGIMIYGDFPSFGNIQKALEENEFEILSSGFDRIPTTVKKLNEEQEADVNKLLEKIEDDDDVQNVYHNMQ